MQIVGIAFTITAFRLGKEKQSHLEDLVVKRQNAWYWFGLRVF
jgi:hypothetical protein